MKILKATGEILVKHFEAKLIFFFNHLGGPSSSRTSEAIWPDPSLHLMHRKMSFWLLWKISSVSHKNVENLCNLWGSLTNVKTVKERSLIYPGDEWSVLYFSQASSPMSTFWSSLIRPLDAAFKFGNKKNAKWTMEVKGFFSFFADLHKIKNF